MIAPVHVHWVLFQLSALFSVSQDNTITLCLQCVQPKNSGPLSLVSEKLLQNFKFSHELGWLTDIDKLADNENQQVNHIAPFLFHSIYDKKILYLQVVSSHYKLILNVVEGTFL